MAVVFTMKKLISNLLKLIISYVICRLILLIGLVSGLLFFIYRYFVGLYLSHKYKCAINFAQPLDANFCISDKNTEQLQIYQIFKGTADIDKLRRRIDKCWLQPCDVDGRWKYIKFRQQVKLELGYYFWIPQPQVRIDNHIVLYNYQKMKTMFDLHEFLSIHASNLPVEEGIFWQFIIVNLPNNFGRSEHMIFFRVHHAFMDEISMSRMYGKLFELKEIGLENVFYMSVPGSDRLINQIMFWIKFISYAPYEFCKKLFKKEKNHSLFGSLLTGINLISISNSICLDRTKEIKKKINCSTNDILVACLISGFREYFISEKEPLPDEMTFQVPVSFHSTQGEIKMENNVTFKSIQAGINEETFNERLMKTKFGFDEIENSAILYFTHIFLKYYINRFPLCITKHFLRRFSSTAVVNCLFTRDSDEFDGYEPMGQQVCLTSANGISGCGIAVTITSDLKNALYAIKVDSGVVKCQENVDKLIGLIVKEFDEFCNTFVNNEK